MPFPKSSAIEIPILHELIAVGGVEEIKFLYERLVSYFPQISAPEAAASERNAVEAWRKQVQRAGRELDQNGFLKRRAGVWTITDKGRRLVATEAADFEFASNEPEELSHGEIQQKLVGIGKSLGFHAQTEFEFYDVVWRENEKSPRLSHVFEVQSKGNIDSAFAKLKRAHDAQRSKIYLVLSTERDLNRARKSLEREFQGLENNLTILTFPQIDLISKNLNNIAEILREFLLR